MALQALLAASLFANGLALLVSLSRTLDRAIRPLATVLQVMPVIAIAPLFVIWAGIDHPERAITALATIVAFFPIFSGAVSGLAEREARRIGGRGRSTARFGHEGQRSKRNRPAAPWWGAAPRAG